MFTADSQPYLLGVELSCAVMARANISIEFLGSSMSLWISTLCKMSGNMFAVFLFCCVRIWFWRPRRMLIQDFLFISSAFSVIAIRSRALALNFPVVTSEHFVWSHLKYVTSHDRRLLLVILKSSHHFASLPVISRFMSGHFVRSYPTSGHLKSLCHLPWRYLTSFHFNWSHFKSFF